MGPNPARPVWATEPIELHEHDPAWATRASAFRKELRGLLSRWLVGDIEHVGSTAVPGLPAKPVLDLMAPVSSLQEAAAADPVLTEAGWCSVPTELDERPWRRFYVLPDGDRRVAHLHLVERDHPKWHETLAFRDALRSRPHLAREYGDLKRSLAEQHGDDREAYTASKTGFVEGALADLRH